MPTFIIDIIDEQTAGIFHCYNDGTIYHAYKVPRCFIDKVTTLEYIEHSSVYLFFGVRDGEDDHYEKVHIMSTNPQKTAKEALTLVEKNYSAINWTEAIIFTTENNAWGIAELLYLKNAFHDLIKNSDRYCVANSPTQVPMSMTKRTKATLDDFIIWATNLLNILGYKVSPSSMVETQTVAEYDSFESQSEPSETEEITTSADFDLPVIPNTPSFAQINYPLLLHMKLEGIKALGLYDGKTLTVIKGSTLNPITDELCSANTKNKRDKYLICKNTYVVTENILFKNPNSAAEFINGAPLDGYENWFNEDEICLKELLKEKKKQPAPSNEPVRLYMKYNGAHATGWYDGNIFTVCKGSVVYPIMSSTCPDSVDRDRKKYAHLIDKNFVLTDDIVFKSPSGASCFISYRVSNGKTHWKDENGVSLEKLITLGRFSKNKSTRAKKGSKRNTNMTGSISTVIMLYMNSRGSNASGTYDGTTFVILKGSTVCTEKVPSCNQQILNLRKRYADKLDRGSVLTENITFNKPSTAAEFVTMRSENGYRCWHDDHGISLGTILGRK